ncbi:SET domain-containing protein [Piedraia hortae CBS 480.64]|uniref:SET domain-containing protein n=1 Tax=Piedraia hortae CBS 480.64 TaxID=1314780 RepID=A0A6A7C0D7_9PEZI|nr:SET domain-containing protein [Piedraia hortae CBS 480.64]
METAKTKALTAWLQQHGGFLHKDIKLCHDEQSGMHLRAFATIEPDTVITKVPLTLSLSSLNALVDKQFSVFWSRRSELDPAAVGYFYLALQWINRETSFWQPYLEALPQPGEDFSTALWFDRPEDVDWLFGTDVLVSMQCAKELQEGYYHKGIQFLKEAGVDVEPITWDLYRWAFTIFSSRAFSSRFAKREDSQWVAFDHGKDGNGQASALSLDKSWAEFPVLFPVQDITNHKPNARVLWEMDSKDFCFTVEEKIDANSEIFNNYATKGNDELLMGYGFCIPDNPNDGVSLALKPPAADLQTSLREARPNLFTPSGTWNQAKMTFRVRKTRPNDANTFVCVPELLLEILLYVARYERELPFKPQDDPLRYIIEDSDGRRYKPRIARMLVVSLSQTLQPLIAGKRSERPSNSKQKHAQIYRNGQISIRKDLILNFKTVIRSLFKTPKAPCPTFLTLERLYAFWQLRARSHARQFLDGISLSAHTLDLNLLRRSGWEDDAFVLLLAYMFLDAGPENVEAKLPPYMPALLSAPEVPKDLQEQTKALMKVVRIAHQNSINTVWNDPRWSETLIMAFGKMFMFESMEIVVPLENKDEKRLIVYLHDWIENVRVV